MKVYFIKLIECISRSLLKEAREHHEHSRMIQKESTQKPGCFDEEVVVIQNNCNNDYVEVQ